MVLPDKVIKAWSLVFLLEAARTLARLAFERSGQLLYQVGSRYILRFEPRSGDPETALFASALQSASFAKIKSGAALDFNSYKSTATHAPQPTGRPSTSSRPSLAIYSESGQAEAVGQAKIALRGHRLS